MNRSELIILTADRANEQIEHVEDIINHFFDLCTDSLRNGETVHIRRFGKFEPRTRRAMVKPNPMSGDIMEIPERLSLAFIPSDLLKERLNSEG